MKSVCFSITLLFLFASARAQQFYYIETSNMVDQLLKTRLEKLNQYVVPSAIRSDYTVRTRVESKDDSRELSLEIVLADSVTQQEIYRSYELVCFTPGQEQPQLMYSIAIRNFLQRRLGEIVLTVQQDHSGLFRRELKERKDKT